MFNNIFAQDTHSDKHNWSFTLGGGGLIFQGDIQSKAVPTAGGSFSIGKRLHPLFGIRGQVLCGQFYGEKFKNKITSNGLLKYGEIMRFKCPFFYETSFNVDFNLSHLMGIKDNVNIYILAGGGLIRSYAKNWYVSNGKTEDAFGYDLTTGKRNGRWTNEVVFPVGLGIKQRLSEHFDMGIEATYHIGPNMDKLDAYVGEKTDRFEYVALSITYSIGLIKSAASFDAK